MIKIGLTSVTFNNLTAFDVIKYSKSCGISTIEWGSDVHAPIGDPLNAKKIRKECENAGISVSSYGSYYKCGEYENAKEEFEKYIEIAKTLGAPTIRIWVGEKNFEEANDAYVQKIVDELKMICDMAKKEDLQIGCELHNGTLCNKKESSLEIVKRVDRDNFGMYFQYDWNFSMEYNCDTLKSFLPFLKNVHVFNVDDKDGFKRYSLGEHGGVKIWEEFVGILKENKVKTNLLFEFLPEATEEYLKKETEILKDIVK